MLGDSAWPGQLRRKPGPEDVDRRTLRTGSHRGCPAIRQSAHAEDVRLPLRGNRERTGSIVVALPFANARTLKTCAYRCATNDARLVRAAPRGRPSSERRGGGRMRVHSIHRIHAELTPGAPDFFRIQTNISSQGSYTWLEISSTPSRHGLLHVMPSHCLALTTEDHFYTGIIVRQAGPFPRRLARRRHRIFGQHRDNLDGRRWCLGGERSELLPRHAHCN